MQTNPLDGPNGELLNLVLNLQRTLPAGISLECMKGGMYFLSSNMHVSVLCARKGSGDIDWLIQGYIDHEESSDYIEGISNDLFRALHFAADEIRKKY
jgi:hypothetical protein